MNAMTETLAISYVPEEAIPGVWPVVAPILKRATDRSRGRYEVTDLLQSLFDRRHMLWVVHEGEEITSVILTRVAIYPRCKAVAIDWIAGKDTDRWVPEFDRVIRDYARLNDCAHVEATGRPGWGPAMKKLGWQTELCSFVVGANDGR